MKDRSVISTARSYAFGAFVVVPEQQLLLQNGTAVRIGGRALDILTTLVEQAGELVSKDDLLSRVWPATVVDESNLKVNVAALRRTLGEGSAGARYIATVSGRGYRFVAPVRASGQRAPLRDIVRPPPRTHNLPAPATRIIGRDDTVDIIDRQLEETRLLTIVGDGGIGKTTVALALAERAIVSFEHGVWFVDLASVGDPMLVPATIAGTIGLTVHSAEVHTALRAFLRERELMLVLDNCEHLVAAVAVSVERILADAARVRVLATSREPLRARGERIFRLSPLATPPNAPGLTAADAMAFPAIELFVERAAASAGGFTLTDTDAPVVAEICGRLDGMALAIELAATRLDTFRVRELLDLLDDRFRLLRGWRTAPERHQTLTATLDWSYNLLPDSEKTILRRLSVFAGPFSLESACAVSAVDDGSRVAPVADVANLVAKSLVAADTVPVATRYRLLDTTRGYARRKLSESGELDAIRQRYAEHLRDRAERAEAEWETRPTAEWLALYGRDVDDIRSALNWAFGSCSISVGVALTVAAIPFWEHLSLVDECRTSVERALASIPGGSRHNRDRMKLLTALGTTLLHTRGPLPDVKDAWTTALRLAEQLGDHAYQLRCLWGLCDYHTWTGAHQSALTIAHRIRAIANERKDLAASTNVERQTGTALRYLGETADARRSLERMISRYVPPVARSDIARFQLDPRSAARGTLANVLWLQGHPDQAIAMARRQLEEARAADHALALCNALVHAACPIALLVGDLSDAERLLAMIESHVAKHAMTVWSAMGLCLRGEWLLKSGDAAGLAALRRALDQLCQTGFRMRYPAHLGALAEGLAAHGDVGAAHAAIDDAIALSADSGEVWCMAELLRIKGNILYLEDGTRTTRAAADQYLQALEWARRQGALSWELRGAISLAELWHRSGASEQARNLLSSTYVRFEEGFGTRDVLRARALLDELRKAGDGRPRADSPNFTAINERRGPDLTKLGRA
ncbi:ATP-binding protein [Chelatococcus reniformis]|uniref:Transcriptional regulator n=1 Tax=Chelatococcus reniformis TaxID=1494448 RepID=A0A916X7U2_9HYPH|nr:winged helix-turn-helix domain-containing protein [Chelatococcus reniformis]GGC47863.1 transcriptional regulator [Chelatococcus reniformis]